MSHYERVDSAKEQHPAMGLASRFEAGTLVKHVVTNQIYIVIEIDTASYPKQKFYASLSDGKTQLILPVVEVVGEEYLISNSRHTTEKK